MNGPEAFDRLDRIPRLAWADYLAWFQQATNTNVRYRTRLLEIEPQGDVLRLHLEADGARRVETTRKLVLANGYAGAGGPNVPDFVRALPQAVWTHTDGPHSSRDVHGQGRRRHRRRLVGVRRRGGRARGRRVRGASLQPPGLHRLSGAGSTTRRNAGAAAARRPPTAATRTSLELTYELPDVVRWRNFLLGDRRVASVPLDSLERVVAFSGFRIHLNTSLADVAMSGNGQVSARAGRTTMRFDHLIAGTGYRIDLAAQPELARIHEHIALWRDRFKPAPGDESTAGGYHPYLGPGFEFLPRRRREPSTCATSTVSISPPH